MKTYRRMCIKDWEITDESGNNFNIEKGKTYRTSAINCAAACGPAAVKDHVVVFSNFWVPVPIENFVGEIEL